MIADLMNSWVRESAPQTMYLSEVQMREVSPAGHLINHMTLFRFVSLSFHFAICKAQQTMPSEQDQKLGIYQSGTTGYLVSDCSVPSTRERKEQYHFLPAGEETQACGS